MAIRFNVRNFARRAMQQMENVQIQKRELRMIFCAGEEDALDVAARNSLAQVQAHVKATLPRRMSFVCGDQDLVGKTVRQKFVQGDQDLSTSAEKEVAANACKRLKLRPIEH